MKKRHSYQTIRKSRSKSNQRLKSKSSSRSSSRSKKTIKKHKKRKSGKKGNKKKYIRVNSKLYSKPSKRGGEFLLFPEYNALKNTTIDGVSNFFSGLSGSNNTQSGNVMDQPLQSGEYDITGSKQILSATQSIVGPEPQPNPMPQPTTCAPVTGANSIAEGSTQTSASSNAASTASVSSVSST